MTKVYLYKGCGTCRQAMKWLEERGVAYAPVPIRETPPTRPELARMLEHVGGELRRLFNTSGGDYKALGLKDKLATMPRAEALELLSKNGNLVKRPFVLSPKGGAVGFKPDEWARLLG